MGFGNFSSRSENDMILRNAGTGGMQVYDISTTRSPAPPSWARSA
jgi:hypothetical protein